jgi:hypothetical protein
LQVLSALAYVQHNSEEDSAVSAANYTKLMRITEKRMRFGLPKAKVTEDDVVPWELVQVIPTIYDTIYDTIGKTSATHNPTTSTGHHRGQAITISLQ